MDDDPTRPLYLSTAEVAEHFGLRQSTLRQWRSQGTGPVATKFGGQVLYQLSEIERWEAEQLEASAREHQSRGSGYQFDHKNRQQKL